MKKFYYLFVVMALSLFAGLQARADEVTKTATEITGSSANATALPTDPIALNDDITVTFSKGSNTQNTPAYYTSGNAIRVYGGNTVTVKGAEGVTITKIDIESPAGANAFSTANAVCNVGTISGSSWDGSTNEVEFTKTGTSGHIRLVSMTVTYTKGGGGEEPVEPDPVEPDPVEPTGPVLTISDVLDEVSMGLNGSTTYADYKNIKIGSDAVYFAQCANDKNSIQLRSNNNNSGVVTTVSGGRIEKITVDWNSGTLAARTLNVYGSNTAYTAPSALYNASTAGTMVAGLVCSEAVDGVSEYTFTEPFKYFGIRSNGSAMYLNKVVVSWRAEIVDGILPGQPVFSVPGGMIDKGTEVELTSPFDQEVEIYYTTDGTEPTKASTKYTAPIVVDKPMTIKAIIAYEEYTTAVASATYDMLPEYTTLAEINNLENKTQFVFAAPLTVVYTADSYNYVYDGATFGLLYKANLGVAAGDVIAAGFKASLSIYNGLYEIVPSTALTVEGKAADMPQPTVVAGADVKAALTTDKANCWLTLEEIRLPEASPATNANFIGYFQGEEANDTITLRNNFKLGSTPAGKYNITGFVGVFKTDVQFYPTEYQECTFDFVYGDMITPAVLGVDGEQAKEYTAELADGNAYNANVAGMYGAMVMTPAEGSGIVTTAAEATASAVTVYWNDSTDTKLVFDVYGSDKPYTSASELVYMQQRGTYLGSLKMAQAADGVSTLALNREYKYLGFRVNNGTAYIDSIKVDYAVTLHEGDVLPYKPEISLASGFVQVGTKVEITSPIAGPSIYYTTDGTEPTAASNLYTEAITIDGYTQLQAVLAYGGYMSEVASAEYMPAIASLAEAEALEEGSKFMMDADLTVVYAYGSEPANAYVYDGSNYGLLTAEMSVKAGAVVAKGWTGTVEANCHMLADSVEISAEAGTVPEPKVIEAFNADSVSVNEYVLIRKVSFMDDIPGEAEAFTGLDDKDTEVNFYNMFEIDRESAGTYDVTGFIGLDEDGVAVVYPTRLATPAGIADIEAEGAEAVYYNLQGIRVSDPAKGQIYIRVAGSNTQKVLVK